MAKILFSPVGGSDPIRNFRDGSMLHICRHYKPDIVYLYFSEEMYNFHKKDNRYVYCLEQLQKQTGHPMTIECLPKEEYLKDVHDHEVFYEKFRHCISEIAQRMTEGDELLLNISSGTPSMKNALLMLYEFAEYPFTAIQVETPLKQRNYTDEDIDTYNVQEQWECNEDCSMQTEKRCQEVQGKNLSTLIKENIIKQYLKSYEYVAAHRLADEMGKAFPKECLRYLEQCVAREALDIRKVNQIEKEIGFNPMPIKRDDSREVVEYLLIQQLKERRGDYDDFIRGITPIILKLFECVLKKQCHISIGDYYSKEEQVVVWDKEKLKDTEVLKILNSKYDGRFRYGTIYSAHLEILILELSNNKKINDVVSRLRTVEKNARNRAAHTVVSITQDTIKAWTGIEPREIVSLLRKLAEFCVLEPSDDSEKVWNSYDEMNDRICKVMKEKILK